jgi:hypothetical protein
MCGNALGVYAETGREKEIDRQIERQIEIKEAEAEAGAGAGVFMLSVFYTEFLLCSVSQLSLLG